MSRNIRVFDCSPDEVFDVLEDGWSYAMWVVGASRIRDVDAAWPAPGSRIHHSVGVWPLLIDDTSSVEMLQRPDELLLTVRAWPAGQGRVRITCRPESGHTVVTLEEDATSGPALGLLKPIRDLMLHRRNEETLRRLAYLAVGRSQLSARGSSPASRAHGS
jgi:hypothetical protein